MHELCIYVCYVVITQMPTLKHWFMWSHTYYLALYICRPSKVYSCIPFGGWLTSSSILRQLEHIHQVGYPHRCNASGNLLTQKPNQVTLGVILMTLLSTQANHRYLLPCISIYYVEILLPYSRTCRQTCLVHNLLKSP